VSRIDSNWDENIKKQLTSYKQNNCREKCRGEMHDARWIANGLIRSKKTEMCRSEVLGDEGIS